MHARIEQLLSLRDGEPVDASVQRHVAECAQCAAELRRLTAHRRALQSMPAYDAPDVLPAIQARLAAPLQQTRRYAWVAVAATAVIAAVVIFAYRQPSMQSEQGEGVRLASTDPQIVLLQERSRLLEGTLQSLPERPSLERVGTAATIDGLEQRIRWLDHHLSDAPEPGLDGDQTQQLWQERVALLDTLVRVRYAESGAYVF